MSIFDDRYEQFYNARASVPNVQEYLESWEEQSQRLLTKKKIRFHRDVPYGENELENMDIYVPEGTVKAVLMFIHGGYWRSLDKKQHGFLAEFFLERGVAVSIINYDLCPNVRIEKIAKQVVAAGSFLYFNADIFKLPREKMIVAGHSAGGHLATMALACVWSLVDARLPKQIFNSAIAISGLYDLRPLLKVRSVNMDLQLNNTSAQKLSPALMPPPKSSSLCLAVGGNEPQGFRDQNELMAKSWGSILSDDIFCPLDNHFSILEQFANPGGAIFEVVAKKVKW